MGAELQSLEAERVEVRSVLEEGRALLPEMAWAGDEQVLRSDGYRPCGTSARGLVVWKKA